LVFDKKTGQVATNSVPSCLTKNGFCHLPQPIFIMKQCCLTLALLAFFACKSEPKFNPELLVGTWNGVDWKVQGQSTDRDAASVFFVFAPFTGEGTVEGTYIAAYGDQKEKGNYRLKGDKLYTTAEDKIEKVVRIVHITADTLVLGMNRVGQEEELVLVERH
jgi:hypothetical protein